MIVIESGGSKSTWVTENDNGEIVSYETVGLHPRELNDEKRKAIEVLVQRNHFENELVYFFGAGCESRDAKEDIQQFLEEYRLKVKLVETDIFASCLAHFNKVQGIVAILGTGAVAAKFDGEKVIQQTSGLGYMLGDEGSGFDLGKRLLQAYYRNELTAEINESIDSYFDHKSIRHTIYGNGGRKIVAGLTKLIFEFKKNPIISKIIETSFDDFCTSALLPMKLQPKTQIFFVGSIAYYFKDDLEKSLHKQGYLLGEIKKEAAMSVYQNLSINFND